MTSTWVTRATSRTLPPAAHGARAFRAIVDRDEPIARSWTPEDEERATIGRPYTIADLQRAVGRVTER